MPPDHPTPFGQLLRQLRLAAGLTQESLAEAAGLSTRSIQELERGQHRPYRDTVERLGRGLGLQGEDLRRLQLAAPPSPRHRGNEPPVLGRYASESEDQDETISSHAPGSGLLPPQPPLDNLPVELTSFVGREGEVSSARELLKTARLLTLTGSGGCGKTRLALRVAVEVVGDYPDGVWLVELASHSDPRLVRQSIASALSIHERPGQPLLETLQTELRDKQLCLLLDNCEHLIDECARVAESLLRASPTLRILATSREALRAAGEVVFWVPSLAVPRIGQVLSAEHLLDYEGVRLLVERAREVRPTFEVTEHNATAVAEVASHLDGIPLALELAAARLDALSIEQIASRLDRAFDLLTRGRRTALRRQQTLRATIDWSYDLLSSPERVIFRRLAVFSGGWTLEAAELVCAGDGIGAEDVLDLLTQLVGRSLVVVEEGIGGQTRYHLLETIREYAREKLSASGEEASVRHSHGNYYLRLVEHGAPEPLIVGAKEWLDRLEVERDNVLAALRWFLDIAAIGLALRMACALASFWAYRGPSEEGRAYLAQVLELRAARECALGPTSLAVLAYLTIGSAEAKDGRPLVEEALRLAEDRGDRSAAALALWISGRYESDPWRAKRDLLRARETFEELGDRIRVLHCDLYLVITLTDTSEYDEARRCCERCVAEARELGIPSLLGQALSVSIPVKFTTGDLAETWQMAEECERYLAQGGDDPLLLHAMMYEASILMRRSEFEAAQRRAELLLERATRSGDLNWIALGERMLGFVASATEDYERAERHVARELAAMRRFDPPLGMALCQIDEGRLARAEGDLPRARQLLTESVTASRAAGELTYFTAALSNLGVVALDEGKLDEARRHFTESLSIRRKMGWKLGVKTSLECFGGLAALEGQPVRALRLLAAGQRLREETGSEAPPVWRRERDPWIERARQALGPKRADAAFAEGQAMTLVEAVEYALRDEG